MRFHKYNVGDRVMYSVPTQKVAPTRKDRTEGRGEYEILQLLPPLGADLQYRIKNGRDGTERMVLERELEPTAR